MKVIINKETPEIKIIEIPKGTVFEYLNKYFIKINENKKTPYAVNLENGELLPFSVIDKGIPYYNSFITIK